MSFKLNQNWISRKRREPPSPSHKLIPSAYTGNTYLGDIIFIVKGKKMEKKEGKASKN